MAAHNFFCRTLFMSSFQGKSRFYEIFSRQKSLFVLLAKKKMLADQHMRCGHENFIAFVYALRSIVKSVDWTTKCLRPNHAHVYFFIFPWPALHVALVYLIHRWPMLEKMTKTLSVPILVAIKVVLRRKDA